MQLDKSQALFKDTMLDHPDAVENPAQDLHDLFTAGNIPLPERLKIYRNNIIGGMTDNVKSTFPILEALVGTPFLELLIRSYILENPPQGGCINTYGTDLPDFIDHFEAAKAMPYLSDVARFEAAQNQAYYAKDDSPLTAVALAALPQDNLENQIISLRACAYLLQSKYPLLAIQGFCSNPDQDAPLNLDQGGVTLLITRPALKTQIHEIAEHEFTFLTHLKNQVPLGQALEKTLAKHAEFDINHVLQKHIELETFAAPQPNIQTE